jgi:hypothetical protein
MIKSCLLTLALLTPALLWSENSAIKIGQTREQATALLGKPVGVIELRDKTLLLYPQGEITLRDDKVSLIDLMSDEEFNADQERLKIEREEWLIQQEKNAAARLKEGQDLKTYKMQSSTFAKQSAKDRVDYWRSFHLRYPEVDVSDQIAGALESYEVELAELKNQQKIAELEARVALAEQEAANARLETEKLRKETEAVSNSEIRIRNDYITPYNYYYRPPTVVIYSNKQKNKPNKPNKSDKPDKPPVSNKPKDVNQWKWDYKNEWPN